MHQLPTTSWRFLEHTFELTGRLPLSTPSEESCQSRATSMFPFGTINEYPNGTGRNCWRSALNSAAMQMADSKCSDYTERNQKMAAPVPAKQRIWKMKQDWV